MGVDDKEVESSGTPDPWENCAKVTRKYKTAVDSIKFFYPPV